MSQVLQHQAWPSTPLQVGQKGCEIPTAAFDIHKLSPMHRFSAVTSPILTFHKSWNWCNSHSRREWPRLLISSCSLQIEPNRYRIFETNTIICSFKSLISGDIFSFLPIKYKPISRTFVVCSYLWFLTKIIWQRILKIGFIVIWSCGLLVYTVPHSPRIRVPLVVKVCNISPLTQMKGVFPSIAYFSFTGCYKHIQMQTLKYLPIIKVVIYWSGSIYIYPTFGLQATCRQVWKEN